MTRLLASVTDAEEVETVIGGGADIIDLKDPASGALGALPIGQLHSLVDRIARRRPVSATTGDLPADPELLSQAISRTAATGVDYVKVGFFGTDNLPACLKAVSHFTANQAIVAVLFADRSPPLHNLTPFAAAGLTGVMLDTADKGQGGLLAHVTLRQLYRFVDQTNSLGLLSGLAGSLRLEDVPQLLPIEPDYLGFRGALCLEGQRERRLDPGRVGMVRRAMGSTVAAALV